MTQDFSSSTSGNTTPSGGGGSGGGSSGGGTGGAGQGGDRSFDRAVNATHEAVDKAAASLDRAAERMKQRYDEMSALEREWMENCRTCVRDHPLASIAAAALAGLLIGRLTSRH